MTFDSYAQYYDLFYQEKDYQGEATFLEKIGDFLAGCSILDLGCGTGGHVLPLAKRGYQLTGVDISEGMVGQAIMKAERQAISATFLHGDVRSVRLGKKFDRVISMFAVMGYQVSNQDFLSALQTAREHLAPGGLFIFDTWFGPAVLAQMPETRVLERVTESLRVIRIASPENNPLANTVTVNYTVLKLEGKKVLDETRESHPMRYFFAPEVEFFAKNSGFSMEMICPFVEPERQPNSNDWNVTWVLRAV